MIYGGAAGVCNASVGVSSNCGDARGGLFDDTDSSTWIPSDQDFLGLDQGLGYEGVGQYGMLCSNAGWN